MNLYAIYFITCNYFCNINIHKFFLNSLLNSDESALRQSFLLRRKCFSVKWTFQIKSRFIFPIHVITLPIFLLLSPRTFQFSKQFSFHVFLFADIVISLLFFIRNEKLWSYHKNNHIMVKEEKLCLILERIFLWIFLKWEGKSFNPLIFNMFDVYSGGESVWGKRSDEIENKLLCQMCVNMSRYPIVFPSFPLKLFSQIKLFSLQADSICRRGIPTYHLRARRRENWYFFIDVVCNNNHLTK